MAQRSILIVGGGTAGWLTAAYLARHLDITANPHLAITVLESAEIGIIGVGEGTFPTIRNTLRYIGVDERAFVRAASATFKQGIRFDDWLHTPGAGRHSHFLHPFEPPFQTDGPPLVNFWLMQDPATRPPFAEAMTIQNRVAEAQRAPKRSGEEDYSGPLNYAYHFDAVRLAAVLAERAQELGVRRIEGNVEGVDLEPDSGAIARVVTREHGDLSADLYVDCTGFRAALIGGALGTSFKSARQYLFTNRALACKLPYAEPDAPIHSYTIAAAHQGGWTWDIGLAEARGIGCVYSADHISDDQAAATLDAYTDGRSRDLSVREIRFEAGYRPVQWKKNCVAVGLAGGFLEPLESTGVVMIEAAAAMIAELFPHHGPIDAPARRFNEVMAARYDNIITFLKLHYCLSRRDEPFWRDNGAVESVPERLQDLLEQWRYRPPSRYDFTLDLEAFAFFNYQYILYGMDFDTALSPSADELNALAQAEKIFSRIRTFSERAAEDLPAHRDLIRQINGG